MRPWSDQKGMGPAGDGIATATIGGYAGAFLAEKEKGWRLDFGIAGAFAGFVAAMNAGIGSLVAAGNNRSKRDVRNRRVLPGVVSVGAIYDAAYGSVRVAMDVCACWP